MTFVKNCMKKGHFLKLVFDLLLNLYYLFIYILKIGRKNGHFSWNFCKNHCKIRTMEIPKMMRWHFQRAAYCRGNVCITWICHSFVGFCEHVSGVKKYRPNKKHICKILLKNERPTTLRRIGSKLSGKY